MFVLIIDDNLLNYTARGSKEECREYLNCIDNICNFTYEIISDKEYSKRLNDYLVSRNFDNTDYPECVPEN